MNGNKKFFDVVDDLHTKFGNPFVDIPVGGCDGERVTRSGPRPVDDAAPRGEAPSDRLESSSSNLTRSEQVESMPFDGATLCASKCRCRTCPTCGPRLGWIVRQNILSKSHLFKFPAMFTLTVDRSRFENPQDAHRQITEGGYISRLMKRLGIKRWFWVLEFQTKSGIGWPHWHLMVDLGDVGGFLNLKLAWRLWRDRWKLGGLDLQTKAHVKGYEYVVNYVTKYMTKMPPAFPTWVLDRERAIRFCGASKAVGSITGQPKCPAPAPPESGVQFEFKYRAPRTLLLLRMAKCGMKTTVFLVSGDVGTGKADSTQWMGTVNATPDDLFEHARQGLISLRIEPIVWGEREILVATDASIGGVVAALKRAASELADVEVGHTCAWEHRINERQLTIQEHHAAFWANKPA